MHGATFSRALVEHNVALIAEPEDEATNLDAQVAERLYLCMFICLYVRHSQLRTPRSWP